jgi:hypothetical protein
MEIILFSGTNCEQTERIPLRVWLRDVYFIDDLIDYIEYLSKKFAVWCEGYTTTWKIQSELRRFERRPFIGLSFCLCFIFRFVPSIMPFTLTCKACVNVTEAIFNCPRYRPVIVPHAKRVVWKPGKLQSHKIEDLFDVELYLTVHKSFVSTQLNIIHRGCTFHLRYPYMYWIIRKHNKVNHRDRAKLT